MVGGSERTGGDGRGGAGAKGREWEGGERRSGKGQEAEVRKRGGRGLKEESGERRQGDGGAREVCMGRGVLPVHFNPSHIGSRAHAAP